MAQNSKRSYDVEYAPFRGGLLFAMINLYIKLEVSISIHYKNKKVYAKCRKWDGMGSLELLKVNRAHKFHISVLL